MLELMDALAALRARNEPVPYPLRLPSLAELEAVERNIGQPVPDDLRR